MDHVSSHNSKSMLSDNGKITDIVIVSDKEDEFVPISVYHWLHIRNPIVRVLELFKLTFYHKISRFYSR